MANCLPPSANVSVQLRRSVGSRASDVAFNLVLFQHENAFTLSQKCIAPDNELT
jgi:hypothetical protein